ncbi:MAG TPA: NAD(P)H-binding protein [Burkholderiales bacterium]|jgi:putative NADH-flavin reductase|nr:NAD(P)H-binding protein [Burkholderiales bacterium]
MRLLVLGATGGTGLEVMRQALAQGHEITAFVRDPAKLQLADARLRVVPGALPADAAPLDAALDGRDAVICSLGVRNAFKSGALIEGALRVLVPAMERASVRRLLLVSANGVGETRARSPLLPRILYRLLLGDIFADKAAGEAIVRASSLEWTIAYPVLLTDGPRTGTYRAGETLELRGMPKIARADVADFLLRELAARAFVRKGVVLSN